MISKHDLEMRRATFRPGVIVELIDMDDPQAPPFGTRGEVKGVDDMGHVLVSWENGSSLSVIPEAGDRVSIIVDVIV